MSAARRIDPWEPYLGHVDAAAAAVVTLANAEGCEARCEFNGTDIVARPGTTEIDAYKAWDAEMARKRDEWLASPECKRQREAMEREARDKAAAFRDAIATAAPLALRDPERWGEFVKANTEPYGAACVSYAETWGRLMQARIARGETVMACAEATSHLADQDGITGFMHGAAVSMLAQCWEYGEDLRRWRARVAP